MNRRQNRKARRAHLQPPPSDVLISNMAAIFAFAQGHDWRSEAWEAECARQLEALKRSYAEWKDHAATVGWRLKRVPWHVDPR